jgi:hypothetical protein
LEIPQCRWRKFYHPFPFGGIKFSPSTFTFSETEPNFPTFKLSDFPKGVAVIPEVAIGIVEERVTPTLGIGSDNSQEE